MFLSFVSDLKGIKPSSALLQSRTGLSMCALTTQAHIWGHAHTHMLTRYPRACTQNRHSIRFVGRRSPSMVPWLLQGDPSELLAQDRVTGGVSGGPELPGLLLPAGGWDTRGFWGPDSLHSEPAMASALHPETSDQAVGSQWASPLPASTVDIQLL